MQGHRTSAAVGWRRVGEVQVLLQLHLHLHRVLALGHVHHSRTLGKQRQGKSHVDTNFRRRLAHLHHVATAAVDAAMTKR